MRIVGTVTISESAVSAANVPFVLRRLKAYRGLTDQQIAVRSGMKRSTVQSRMAGKPVPTDELDELAHALGVPVVVLFMPADEALRWVLDHPEMPPAADATPQSEAKGASLRSVGTYRTGTPKSARATAGIKSGQSRRAA